MNIRFRINPRPYEGWTEKCPVCKKGSLSGHEIKTLWGLMSKRFLTCNKCNSLFSGTKNGLFRLEKIGGPKWDSFWYAYGNKAFNGLEWSNIADGGLSNEEQEVKDRNTWLKQVMDYEAPMSGTLFPSIVLNRDEKLIFDLSNIELLESRAIRQGGYGGFSVRIVKGLSVHMGKIQSESHDELRNQDTGVLALTNERLVFTGKIRSINIKLKDISSIKQYLDGISATLKNRNKPYYFVGMDKIVMGITIGERHYSQKLDISLVYSLIQKLSLSSAI